jgi:peptidoglycan/LPS O-acetylase OafA/YrhL
LLAPHSPIYTNDNWAEAVFGPPAPFAKYTIQCIVVSILSLQTASGLAPPMGSDGPLWSLGFEWIFYFAFPALLLGADRGARRLGLSLCAVRGATLILSVLALIATHKADFAILWLVWVGGAVAHVVVEKGRWPTWLRWFGAAVCVAGFAAEFRFNYRLADAVIGLGAIGFLCLFPKGERGLDRALDRKLAGVSYTLYLTHLPVLAFASMMFNERGLLPAGGAPIGWAGAGMMAASGVVVGLTTLVFHLLFEANTDRLRAALSKRIYPSS